MGVFRWCGDHFGVNCCRQSVCDMCKRCAQRAEISKPVFCAGCVRCPAGIGITSSWGIDAFEVDRRGRVARVVGRPDVSRERPAAGRTPGDRLRRKRDGLGRPTPNIGFFGVSRSAPWGSARICPTGSAGWFRAGRWDGGVKPRPPLSSTHRLRDRVVGTGTATPRAGTVRLANR